MSKKIQRDEETQFLRGDVGIDGQATEEERDEAEIERDKAKAELARNRTYLGREFLTWLLYRSESGEPIAQVEEEDVRVLFTGRIVLKGIAGDATELTLKGSMSPYADVTRHAMARGLLVHAARLRIEVGERRWAVTVDAEHLDFRSAELPAVLSEEEDDKITERLDLAERLSVIVDALLDRFLGLRKTAQWRKVTVPALRTWMTSDEATHATGSAVRTPGAARRVS